MKILSLTKITNCTIAEARQLQNEAHEKAGNMGCEYSFEVKLIGSWFKEGDEPSKLWFYADVRGFNPDRGTVTVVHRGADIQLVPAPGANVQIETTYHNPIAEFSQ